MKDRIKMSEKISANKQRFQRHKSTFAFVIAVILILTMIPSISAQTQAVDNQATKAYISAFPNPVGVNQEIGIDIWIHPYPPTALLDVHGFMVNITRPDGTIERKGPFNAYKSSSSWFLYTPKTTGVYKFDFNYPGESYFNGSLVYKPDSDSINVTVQMDPVPLWPEYPYTNDYWTRPLSAEHRSWYNVAGNWLNNGNRGNEWSPDVKAPHVMWKTPIDIGGVVGGEMGISNYYEGSAYEAKAGSSIIIGGYYFNSGFLVGQRTSGGTKCYNLRTGELVWYNATMSVNFGWQMRIDSGNMHAIIPYLVQTGSTYRFYDPLSGKELFNFANASSPTTNFWTYTPNNPIWPTTNDGTWPGTWIAYVAGNNARGSYVLKWNATKAFADNNWITYQSNNRITSLATWAPPTGSPSPGVGDWRKGIEWNVTSPAQWGYQRSQIPNDGNTTNWPKAYLSAYTSDEEAGVLIATINANGIDNGAFAGWSMKTGALLWSKNITDITYLSKYYTASDGKYVIYALIENYYVVLDSKTGNELFRTDVLPGGGYSTYNNAPTIYKGVLYSITYSGYVIAHSLTDGKLIWATQIEPFNSETPYEGGTPMRAAPAFSQNYMYLIDQVKTDENPMRRNQGTTALDIATGKVIWKLHIGPGGESSSITGVADGYLATYGGYTSERYILGKGPSKITVSAPQTSVPKGQSVVITGTITDQSPALKDTPCIADVDMAEWMAYKFLQHPFPENATGVPITLTATGQDGSPITIANGLISDTAGKFGYKWTPPTDGLWTITAVFMGTDSYGSSYDTTYMGVDVAPSALPVITPAPTVAPTSPPTATASPSTVPPPTYSANTALYVGIVAVIVFVVIAAIAVILKRRK